MPPDIASSRGRPRCRPPDQGTRTHAAIWSRRNLDSSSRPGSDNGSRNNAPGRSGASPKGGCARRDVTVVDVAVLDDVVGMLQRRDVEGLGLPCAVRHSAIGESCNEPAIAGMPGVALEYFHPETQLVFPVLRQDGNRVRPLHAEANHMRVEWS